MYNLECFLVFEDFLARFRFRLGQQGPQLFLLEELLWACRRWPLVPDLAKELLLLLQELPPVQVPSTLLQALKPWLEEILPGLDSDLQAYGLWIQAVLTALPGWAELQQICLGQTSLAVPAIFAEPLLGLLLQRCYVQDPELERLLTCLRRRLLFMASNLDQAWETPLLLLALQSWNNGYVWAVGAGEAEQAAQVVLPAPGWLIQACYGPLQTGREADPVLASNPLWQALISACREAPAEEARQAAVLPCLTPIPLADPILDFYQASPYPRWLAPERLAVEALVEQLEALFPDIDWQAGLPAEMEVLIAGCGTGQQLVQHVLQQPEARVTGLDISLPALGYAARMLAKAGLEVELYRADLQSLTAWSRRFDLIACGGVLHHLADPEKGLTHLLALLKPGGLLKLGIYSRRGREPLRRLRQHLGISGQETPEQVRRIRQQILISESAEARWVRQIRDFYVLPMCRDLLFHPREQAFSLTELAGWFERHALHLLGFELWNPQHYFVYKQHFPEDPTMRNLANWASLEAELPGLFAGMYVLWLQSSC